MAAIDKDTRLIMTIMYVGAFTHAVLFSLITVGVIMLQKSLFDMVVNERFEMWLLNRKIDLYWEKKARDEAQRKKIKDSIAQRNLTYYSGPQQGYEDAVPEAFLKALE